MEEKFLQTSADLGNFIKESPTAFHAVAAIEKRLKEQGFTELLETEDWKVVPEGKYYIVRNMSSIIAVKTGKMQGKISLQMAASHSDSPSFKVKEHATLEAFGKYAKLNTEGYGGMLCAPWMDRPLSVAGRVVVKNGGEFEQKLVQIDRDLFMIPSLAIHMNREAGEGAKLNKQIDMLPLLGGEDYKEEDFESLIAEAAGTDAGQIYGRDLFLYNRMEPSILGARDEYIMAPRLDDLQCAYGSLMGFLEGENSQNLNVYACFDNEEVGSQTKQGAASTFLSEVLERLFDAFGKTREELRRAVASGLMISCDNAHAKHPNHPEKSDDKNCVYMNEGIVIKSHAGQKYTSDAISSAAFKELCERAKVPAQYFANRSDMAGGSTLGNIAMTQVSMNCVDIGLAQLAMHSACETAGVKDTWYLIQAMKEFYGSHFEMTGKGFSLNS